VAGFLLAVALPDVGGLTALVNPAPTASPAPTATPQPTAASGMALSPIGIQMPADANCEACHVTTAGTVGTKPIPKLGHPLWGFQDCTACHKPDGLVQTAPGHDPNGGGQRRPYAPRAHGRQPALHVLPRRGQARAAAPGHGGPRQLLDLPQRAGVRVPVRVPVAGRVTGGVAAGSIAERGSRRGIHGHDLGPGHSLTRSSTLRG
jgi:hypothetical protein